MLSFDGTAGSTKNRLPQPRKHLPIKNFELSESQLGAMEGKLLECDNDVPALKDSKSKAVSR